MEELKCIKCGSPLNGDDVNINTGLAKCPKCFAVFFLNDGDGKKAAFETGRKETEGSSKDVALPDRTTIAYENGDLVITRKESPVGGVIALVFGLIWNSFIYGLFLPVFIQIGEPFMLLFLAPFCAAGVFVVYFGIATLLNRITIRTKRSTLSIKKGPVPVPGNKEIDVSQIKQLYVKETRHHRSSSSSSSGSSSTYYTYDLHMLNQSGMRKRLVSLTSPESAIFLENQIEKYLGIKDTHVEGEMEF
jgi:hypothetical protein